MLSFFPIGGFFDAVNGKKFELPRGILGVEGG